MSCCLGKLVHLGIAQAPNKSTLSYANEHRPAALYQELFYTALDASAPSSNWADASAPSVSRTSCSRSTPPPSRSAYHSSLGRSSAAPRGVKAHVLMDHDDYLPHYVLLTAARASDVRMAHHFDLPPGSIVAVDRGYNDFRLFARWIAAGVYFVIRPMHHMVYEVMETLEPPPTSNILLDQIIRFTSKKAQQTFKHQLRRVVVWDEANEREIVLLTNHFDFGATTLSHIYKDRWEIELFFKALKQNLKIKSFVGTSENALHIQIWTALLPSCSSRGCITCPRPTGRCPIWPPCCASICLPIATCMLGSPILSVHRRSFPGLKN